MRCFASRPMMPVDSLSVSWLIHDVNDRSVDDREQASLL